MFPTDLLRFRIRTKSETVSQSALISVYVGTFKRVCVFVDGVSLLVGADRYESWTLS